MISNLLKSPTNGNVSKSNTSAFSTMGDIGSPQSGTTEPLSRENSVGDAPTAGPNANAKKVTVGMSDTYLKCNPEMKVVEKPPQRILTVPNEPLKPGSFDNKDSNLIVRVNDVVESERGEKYTIIDILGTGTFGQVFRCIRASDSKYFAVKIVKNKPAYRNQGLLEIKIARILNVTYDPDDENSIVRLQDSFDFKEHVCLLFEILGISLLDVLTQNQYRGLPLATVQAYARQLLAAFVVLEEAKIIHCDLKPENILLTNPGTLSDKKATNNDIKLIDLGSACFEGKTMYSYIQSRFYRSPEVLLGFPYDKAIDMWSLGCVCTETYLGLPLFPGVSPHNQLYRIVDMFSSPPDYLIEQGKHGKNYFKRVAHTAPRRAASAEPSRSASVQSPTVGSSSRKSVDSSGSGGREGKEKPGGVKGLIQSLKSRMFAPSPKKSESQQDVSSASSSSAAVVNPKPEEEISYAYSIKSPEEYAVATNTVAPVMKKYLRYQYLDDVIMRCPVANKASLSSEQKTAELELRKCFLDFLHGLFILDPKKRWTPPQAVGHPFITGEPYLKPYVPPADPPTRSVSRESASAVTATATVTEKPSVAISSSPTRKKDRITTAVNAPPVTDISPGAVVFSLTDGIDTKKLATTDTLTLTHPLPPITSASAPASDCASGISKSMPSAAAAVGSSHSVEEPKTMSAVAQTAAPTLDSLKTNLPLPPVQQVVSPPKAKAAHTHSGGILPLQPQPPQAPQPPQQHLGYSYTAGCAAGLCYGYGTGPDPQSPPRHTGPGQYYTPQKPSQQHNQQCDRVQQISQQQNQMYKEFAGSTGNTGAPGSNQYATPPTHIGGSLGGFGYSPNSSLNNYGGGGFAIADMGQALKNRREAEAETQIELSPARGQGSYLNNYGYNAMANQHAMNAQTQARQQIPAGFAGGYSYFPHGGLPSADTPPQTAQMESRSRHDSEDMFGMSPPSGGSGASLMQAQMGQQQQQQQQQQYQGQTQGLYQQGYGGGANNTRLSPVQQRAGQQYGSPNSGQMQMSSSPLGGGAGGVGSYNNVSASVSTFLQDPSNNLSGISQMQSPAGRPSYSPLTQQRMRSNSNGGNNSQLQSMIQTSITDSPVRDAMIGSSRQAVRRHSGSGAAAAAAAAAARASGGVGSGPSSLGSTDSGGVGALMTPRSSMGADDIGSGVSPPQSSPPKSAVPLAAKPRFSPELAPTAEGGGNREQHK